MWLFFIMLGTHHIHILGWKKGMMENEVTNHVCPFYVAFLEAHFVGLVSPWSEWDYMDACSGKESGRYICLTGCS